MKELLQTQVTDLGVIMDQALSFVPHVEHVVKTALKTLRPYYKKQI